MQPVTYGGGAIDIAPYGNVNEISRDQYSRYPKTAKIELKQNAFKWTIAEPPALVLCDTKLGTHGHFVGFQFAHSAEATRSSSLPAHQHHPCCRAVW